MSIDPVAQLDAYLTALNTAGVRAVMDAAEINPPAVQLRAPVMAFRFGRGCYECEWTARLILPGSGPLHAFKAAVPLIATIQDALSGAIVTARPADFDIGDGGGPLPGYELTWSTR